MCQIPCRARDDSLSNMELSTLLVTLVPDPTIHSLSDKIIGQSNVSKIISKEDVLNFECLCEVLATNAFAYFENIRFNSSLE